MKQLTKQEIIELRKEAFVTIFYPNGIYNIGQGEKLRKAAIATIEADEKAGVLMLIDEDATKDCTDILINAGGGVVEISSNGIYHNHLGEYEENDLTIIRRAGIPAYQCSKEKQNGF